MRMVWAKLLYGVRHMGSQMHKIKPVKCQTVLRSAWRLSQVETCHSNVIL